MIQDKWLVCSAFADARPKIMAVREDTRYLGLIPWGGVAAKLSSQPDTRHKGTAFCFLPLPITTGLPIHVRPPSYTPPPCVPFLLSRATAYSRPSALPANLPFAATAAPAIPIFCFLFNTEHLVTQRSMVISSFRRIVGRFGEGFVGGGVVDLNAPLQRFTHCCTSTGGATI